MSEFVKTIGPLVRFFEGQGDKVTITVKPELWPYVLRAVTPEMMPGYVNAPLDELKFMGVTLRRAERPQPTYTAAEVKELVEALRVLKAAYKVECDAFRECATNRDGTWADPSDKAEHEIMSSWLNEADEALKTFGSV